MSIEETVAAFGLGADDLAAWQATGRPEDALEDWLTDRVARRPSGARSRKIYGADDVHDFARRAILEALGTPAVPEPLASRTHLYDDDELASLARQSGFTGVRVDRDDGAQLLTARR